jgi:hypothetical protein
MKIANSPLSYLLVGLLLFVCTVDEVAAQRGYKPKPPPAAPVISVLKSRPDVMELQAPYVPGFKLEFQAIAGPGTAGAPTSIAFAPFFQVGTLNFFNIYPVLLLPNTDYTIKVRQLKSSVEFSPWTTFKFKTAATFLARPGIPINLRETSRTATSVTLQWDAPSTGPAASYEYFINGVKTPLTRCGGIYVYCNEPDFRVVTFNLPATGKSLLFGVAARDVELNLSLSSELKIAN